MNLMLTAHSDLLHQLTVPDVKLLCPIMDVQTWAFASACSFTDYRFWGFTNAFFYAEEIVSGHDERLSQLTEEDYEWR